MKISYLSIEYFILLFFSELVVITDSQLLSINSNQFFLHLKRIYFAQLSTLTVLSQICITDCYKI